MTDASLIKYFFLSCLHMHPSTTTSRLSRLVDNKSWQATLLEVEEEERQTNLGCRPCTHIHYSDEILCQPAWQAMLKEAEVYDPQVNIEFQKKDTYLEWFNDRPEFVREAIRALPMDAFYTDPVIREAIYRVYGVVENKDATCSYHVAEAGCMEFREIILGANELAKIDKWSETQLSRIRVSGWPQIFLPPNGWVELVFMMHDKDRLQ